MFLWNSIYNLGEYYRASFISDGYRMLYDLQPLFPGASGVDQLVEIIKVQVIYFFKFRIVIIQKLHFSPSIYLFIYLILPLLPGLFYIRYWGHQPERKLSA